MNLTKESKTQSQKQHDFNPRIVVGIVGSTDFNTMQTLKDFFDTLEGFRLIYIKTSGNPIYLTDKKPSKENNRRDG